jgi:hypothetical protein
LYSLSACIYTGIIYGVQAYSSSHAIFITNSKWGSIFAILALLSWALVGIGALSLILLYYPCRSKHSPYVQATIPLLLVLACSLLFVALGMLLSAAAAGLVFAGSRERYRTYRVDSSVEAWLLPVITGILPAVLFLFEGLSSFSSFGGAMRDLSGPKQRIPRAEDDSLTSEIEGPSGGHGIFGALRGGPQQNQPLDPHQEELVQQLMRLGYRNRGAVIAALQASSWNVSGAEVRLANTQQGAS